MLDLTVCVIGRNEEKRLPALIDSLLILSESRLSWESLFVDSASTDSSVEVARSFFHKVVVLQESPYLCASAGRHVGTLVSAGKWILFLDADMDISKEFIDFLSRICKTEPALTGWVGLNRYIYDNGVIRENAKSYRKNKSRVKHFGGAVLLPRELVLKVGNWNPSIFSNEEIELHTRIREKGGQVCFVDLPMINHYTPKIATLTMLWNIFIPGKPLGKKYYGFGQVLAARWSSKTLPGFVRYFPYPFVYWISIGISIVLFLFGLNKFALTSFLAGCFYIWFEKGMKFIALYFAFLFQGIVGYKHYNPDFTPQISKILEESKDLS